MIKVLVSACLMGALVRYDGNAKASDHRVLLLWRDQGRLVPFCPEVAGGLPTPRPPAEIVGGGGEDVAAGLARVLTADGEDVSGAFLRGADLALAAAQAAGAPMAILKARSPSCGGLFIYDGSYRGKLKAGMGVTAARLNAAGIATFDEEHLDTAAAYLASLEAGISR